MADHNAYYEMLERRASEAALLRLRYDIGGLELSLDDGGLCEHRVVRLIDAHIEKYK